MFKKQISRIFACHKGLCRFNNEIDFILFAHLSLSFSKDKIRRINHKILGNKTPTLSLQEIRTRIMKLFLLVASICGVSILLLCVRILLGKRFIHTHVDGNRALNKQGIHCAQSQDRAARREKKNKIQEKSNK